MALGSGHQTTTTDSAFIAEQWSDEVIAAKEKKLALARLVTNISFVGKKYDTLHIPVPGRGNASQKLANTQVTLVTDTATDIAVLIDQHWEYSKLYEDISQLQAKSSMRRFYTEDAGYALARKIDQTLHLLGAGLNGGSIAGATNLYETAVIGGDGVTAFSGSGNNGTALTDAGLRKAIQSLEDNDYATDELSFVIPPVEASVIRGIDRFTQDAFRGDGSTLITGRIGNLYGVEVIGTSNCPWIHRNSVTSTQSVTFTSAAPTGASFADAFGLTVDWATSSPTDTKYRACLLLHKDALALATQQKVRTQSQYKQEYLGTLVTADTVFGTKELRDYAGVAIIVPA